MGRFKHGLFGECAREIGNGITVLGHSPLRFSITKFIKSIINRSNGSAVLLVLPRGCPVDALIYVANECTALKHLALPSSLIPRQYFTIPNLVCKMKNLEMLTLEDSSNLQETLTPVSLHCKNLVGLDFTPGFALVHILEDEASAIVTLLPNIKHLGLRHTFLQRKFLVMILQGCKELVHLDVRNSIGFNVDDEILKLTSHIRTFMYEGSREFIMVL
ncbi:hypothetical protein F0562_000107 [Nyssa sinensis]|uniref:FBD domain-containing protein n=1 Tax=Nyssa sinensis TaxID=561372 RepID=A0A5J5BYZ0_9ASTE|nr:hypothetical protein F0562_000107 [Nyssa sinensis]